MNFDKVLAMQGSPLTACVSRFAVLIITMDTVINFATKGTRYAVTRRQSRLHALFGGFYGRTQLICSFAACVTINAFDELKSVLRRLQ